MWGAGRFAAFLPYDVLMAEHGSKTKGALAGVGIAAAVGGGIARSADDVLLAGCRAGKSVSAAGEGVAAGRFARSGAGVVDDGLRGVGRAAPRPGAVGRGRPWMVAAGEADDGARLGMGSSLDDVGTYRGASATESVEGSMGETAVDLSLDLLDLSGVADPDDSNPAPTQLRGAIGLATKPFARLPRAVVVQTWADDRDGGVPLATRAGVTRVHGRDVARRGWRSVIEAMPTSNPLVVLASSRDAGASIRLTPDQSTSVAAFHQLCTRQGQQCVTMLCPHDPNEPSACTASLPDIFERVARLTRSGDLNHDRFVSLLGQARKTWDATTNVRIAYVKVSVEPNQRPSFVPVLTKLGPPGSD